MSLYDLQVPLSAEFAGHSIVEEIVIALANNHANLPLPPHQQTLLQLLPYFTSLSKLDQKLVIQDIYGPNNRLSDVVKAMAYRGDRLRSSLVRWASSEKRQSWIKFVDALHEIAPSFNRLTLSGRLRSLFWFAALIYATEYSLPMILMQLVGMFSAMVSFTREPIPCPPYFLSAALAGSKLLLDVSNAFETSSSSIIVSAISTVVILTTFGTNHFLIGGAGLEYWIGLVFSLFAVNASVWMCTKF